MCPTLKTEAGEEVHGHGGVDEASIVLHLDHRPVLEVLGPAAHIHYNLYIGGMGSHGHLDVSETVDTSNRQNPTT